MAFPVTIPNTFSNATSSIPLSQLDNNFTTLVTALNGVANGAETLSNVSITGGTLSNVTLDNVTVDVETLSNVTITNLTVDGTANLTNSTVTANLATITTANVTTLNVSGNTTLGDASGDSVTINAATVSTPNGLNFDSNTFVIDAANNRVGIGTASPTEKLSLSGNLRVDTGYIYFAGNTSTPAVGAGIYRPAADTLGFVINNTERMRIDSAGNLGLGVTPSAWQTASGSRAIQFLGSSLYGYRDTNIILAQNAYFDGSWKYYASSIASGYYSIGSGVHSWHIAPSGTAGNAISLTQAMTLDASGNLLVGQTSKTTSAQAGAKLGVTAGITITNGSYGGYIEGLNTSGTTFGYLSLGAPYNAFNAGEVGLGTSGSVPLLFATNNAVRMRIDSSGNVGIGTSSPVGLLDVVSSGSGVIRARSSTGSGTVGFQAQNSDTGTTTLDGTFFGIDGSEQAYVYNYENAPIIFGTNSTERMRIDSSGNVGIGTSSPASQATGTTTGILDVSASTGGNLVLHRTGSGDTALFSILKSTNGTYIDSTGASTAANNAIIFRNNNTNADQTTVTERMRIDSSGNLLLGGTATPASATASLAIFNGTAPTGSVTNGIILYAEDVSSSSELKVRDEAGNVTTLSPHNFSMIPEGPSEDMAWAYYSEKNGKRINVDMLKLARMVEKLTGEKLVYTEGN